MFCGELPMNKFVGNDTFEKSEQASMTVREGFEENSGNSGDEGQLTMLRTSLNPVQVTDFHLQRPQ